MKKTAIFFLIIFAMTILATSASAQLVPPCDPAFNVCVVTDPTSCGVRAYSCNETRLTPGSGNQDDTLQQQTNDTFDRVMEIMRRHNQTRINILRGF